MPIVVRFATYPEAGSWTLSLITATYGLFLVNTAWLHHADLRKFYHLIFENEALVASLSEAMCRQGCEPGQERVSGDDEPRDPHADERGHRHAPAAPGFAPHLEQREHVAIAGPRRERSFSCSMTFSTFRGLRAANWNSRW